MSEAEIIEVRLLGGAFILSLFSVFFGIVSAYIAGLYFFLNRATPTLRLLAFFVLTMAFLFLGGVALSVSDVIEVMNSAWLKLDIPRDDTQVLRGWLMGFGGSFTLYYVGALVGWAVAFMIYVALGYMTFGYRWPEAGGG